MVTGSRGKQVYCRSTGLLYCREKHERKKNEKRRWGRGRGRRCGSKEGRGGGGSKLSEVWCGAQRRGEMR